MKDRIVRIPNLDMPMSPEVRNYFDAVEDEINKKLAPHITPIMEMISDMTFYEMMCGSGASDVLMDMYAIKIKEMTDERDESD